jgi:hypothetical protein
MRVSNAFLAHVKAQQATKSSRQRSSWNFRTQKQLSFAVCLSSSCTLEREQLGECTLDLFGQSYLTSKSAIELLRYIAGGKNYSITFVGPGDMNDRPSRVPDLLLCNQVGKFYAERHRSLSAQHELSDQMFDNSWRSGIYWSKQNKPIWSPGHLPFVLALNAEPNSPAFAEGVTAIVNDVKLHLGDTVQLPMQESLLADRDTMGTISAEVVNVSPHGLMLYQPEASLSFLDRRFNSSQLVRNRSTSSLGAAFDAGVELGHKRHFAAFL